MAKKNKKKNNNANKNSVKKQFHFVPTATRRDNFDVQHWRRAITAAENIKRPNRTALYDIYSDILLDTHLTSVIEQRENALLKDIIIFRDNNKENPAIEALLELPFFEELVLEIFRAKLWGHSLLWIDIAGGKFNDFELLERKHTIPEKHIFIHKLNDQDGIDYTKAPYNYYCIPVGFKKDLGLLLKAVPWVLLKRGDISDWASFNEIFANPIRKGSYPLYNDDAKQELMEGLRDMGAFGSVIHPKDTDLEFLIANAAGSAETYSKLQAVCDTQLSKLMVGQTMTTDSGSSRSQAEVHLEVSKQYTDRDRRFVINTLNTAFKQLLEWHGFNPKNGKFSYATKSDISQLQARFNIDKELSKTIEYPAEYFYETYNVPLPKGGAKFKTPSAPAPNKETQQNKAPATEQNPSALKFLKSFFA